MATPMTDTIYVSGLQGASKEQIHNHFSQAGPIKINRFTTELRIWDTGIYKAITYEDPSDAETAVQMFNNTIYDGYIIKVMLSTQKQ